MTRPIRPTRCRPCATPKDPKRRRTGRATTVSNKREKKNEDTKYIKRQENKAQIQVPPRGRPGSRHQVSIKPERGHGRESLQSAYIRSHKNGSTSKSSSTNTSSSSSNFKTPSSYTHTHTQTNEHTHTQRKADKAPARLCWFLRPLKYWPVPQPSFQTDDWPCRLPPGRPYSDPTLFHPFGKVGKKKKKKSRPPCPIGNT